MLEYCQRMLRPDARSGHGLGPISELQRLKCSLLPATWPQCRAISVRREGGGKRGEVDPGQKRVFTEA